MLKRLCLLLMIVVMTGCTATQNNTAEAAIETPVKEPVAEYTIVEDSVYAVDVFSQKLTVFPPEKYASSSAFASELEAVIKQSYAIPGAEYLTSFLKPEDLMAGKETLSVLYREQEDSPYDDKRFATEADEALKQFIKVTTNQTQLPKELLEVTKELNVSGEKIELHAKVTGNSGLFEYSKFEKMYIASSAMAMEVEVDGVKQEIKQLRTLALCRIGKRAFIALAVQPGEGAEELKAAHDANCRWLNALLARN